MRLVIDLDEKYKNLFLEVAKAAKATIIVEEPDFWTELPDHVKAGVEKSLKQAESGQTKSFEEVKKILANR
jgi:TRAP-type C4-dicarboxylate transport system substrate-binding protein